MKNENSRIEAVYNGWYDAIHNGYRYGFLSKHTAEKFLQDIADGTIPEAELETFFRSLETEPFSKAVRG
jgi:hypothetical protein